VGSRFVLSGNHADILLAMLPLIVHIRKKADQAALRWSVERMMQELCESQAGGVLVAQHLAHMMLVQALRAGQSLRLTGHERAASVGSLASEGAIS